MRNWIWCLLLGGAVFGRPASLPAYDLAEFLNFAIFNLPPEYVAGIPLEERPLLVRDIFSSPKSKQIDYDHGFLHLPIENASGEATGSIWLKLLPRNRDHPRNSDSPLVYIHVATSNTPDAATGRISYNYTTQVVMWKRRNRDEASWVDVTRETIPESADLKLHLPPYRTVAGARLIPKGYGDRYLFPSQVLVWNDGKLHLRDAPPFTSTFLRDAPLDADRLSILAFRPDPDRELAELIAHAAVTKDERFRALLHMEALRKVPVVSYALAAYEYALDESEAALDFIVEKVAEEGNGDTNSKWMLAYFDEWDRTLEVYRKYDGRDGAAAEASYMFAKERQYFFPENFEKFWGKKMEELSKKP